jgi:VanZ family protein
MVTKREWSCPSFRFRIFCISSNQHSHFALIARSRSPRNTYMAHQTSRLPLESWLLIKYWAPVLLYCGVIVYLSSLSYPSRHLPSFLFGLSDKLVHGVEYGILGILLYRAFHQTTSAIGSIIMSIICVVAFGISDEMHQWFVPNRQADLWDLLADTLGATLFILTWVFITKKYSLRQTLQD